MGAGGRPGARRGGGVGGEVGQAGVRLRDAAELSAGGGGGGGRGWSGAARGKMCVQWVHLWG